MSLTAPTAYGRYRELSLSPIGWDGGLHWLYNYAKKAELRRIEADFRPYRIRPGEPGFSLPTLRALQAALVHKLQAIPDTTPERFLALVAFGTITVNCMDDEFSKLVRLVDCLYVDLLSNAERINRLLTTDPPAIKAVRVAGFIEAVLDVMATVPFAIELMA